MSKDKKTIIVDGKIIGEVESTGSTDGDITAARKLIREKGLEKKITQAQAIFGQAHSFASTASSLYNSELKDSQRRGTFAAPFVVNSTFSIELYLKAIGELSGQQLRGHKLVKLYDPLSTSVRKSIALHVPQCSKNRGLKEDLDLRDSLENLNEVFVEWRYIFEKDRSTEIRIEEMICTMEILHEYCRNSDELKL